MGEKAPSALDKAVATQIANIQKKIGKTIPEVEKLIAATGKKRHGDVRQWLGETFGLSGGDANTLAHIALKTDGASLSEGKSEEELLAEIYSGPKAHLRTIHDALMSEARSFGPFETAPKKGYFSLRRKKQFAMLGPKTNSRFELGLNLKEDISSPRILAQKPGGMCQFVAPLTGPADVDAEIINALRKAYDAAG